MPNVLLHEVLEIPEVIQATYRAAHDRHRQLAGRQAAAEKAQAMIPELENNHRQLDRHQQDLIDQQAQAERTLQAERNRSKFVKLLRGGGAEREACEQLTEISVQLEQVRRARSKTGEELREQYRIAATAPKALDLEHATTRLEELTVLVQSAEPPEVIEAELTWRRDAPREVARLDRQRRTPQQPAVASELFEGITGTIDENFIRRFHTHARRGRESSASDPSWQPPAPGLGHDQGLDL